MILSPTSYVVKPKIIFMGTPEFGVIVLEELCQSEYKPILVFTSPDKPIGRKQIITPPPVKIIAEKYNIQVLQPNKISDFKSQIIDLKPDLILVAAYGQILPKEILEIPKYGCLNIHPSILPKYRGPSPIQYTILNNDQESGVTIILMDEKMDHGPILTNFKIEIETASIIYTQLHNKLAKVGVELFIETIPKWIKGEINPQAQDESKVTFTKIIKKEDGRIDWKKPAQILEREIRAFNPWPSSYCFWQEKRLKLLKSDVLIQSHHGPFGPLGKTFLAPDEKIAIQTGKDFLIIKELQIEGKKPLNSEEFMRGQKNFIGVVLR